MPQHRRVNQDNAENASNNQKFQKIVKSQIVRFRVRLPQLNPKENHNDETDIKINIHVADIKNSNEQVYRNDCYKQQETDADFRNVFPKYDGYRLVIIGQITLDVFEIFHHFTHQKQDKKKAGMRKNHCQIVGVVFNFMQWKSEIIIQ